MKISGATYVRNECDIIEAFVRHNLTVLDEIAVIDHGSTDGTVEILAALVQEGLPVRLQHDDTPQYRQSVSMTRLVCQALREGGADYVFALDGDEFLKIPSRPKLEAALRTLPPHIHAIAEWQTYIPTYGSGKDELQCLAAARRMRRERNGLQKVLVAKAILEQPALIVVGNHMVARRREAPADYRIQHARLTHDEATVAHFPIRSAEQFAGKIAVGWLACLLEPGLGPGQAFHWQEAFAHLRAGEPLHPDLLKLAAANYSVPEAEWAPVTDDDLVADPFLAPIELRYGAMGNRDPLAKVVRFAERIALALAVHTAKEAPGA